MAVTLTDSAQDHVRRHIENRGSGLGIRLGVKTTGCSGLSYVLEFVDEQQDEDNVFAFENFSVFVDPKSYVYLDGTQVDFIKEGLNEGFEFTNPNSKGECGCGESFNV